MPRGDGYFRRKGSVLYWEFMFKGERYSIRLGKITKSEARSIVADIKAKIIRGEWGKEGNPPIKELIEEYRNWYVNFTRARERSVQTELARLRRLEEFFGKIRVGELTAGDVERYKRKRLREGVHKNTINRELRILRGVLSRAKRAGLFTGEVLKIELFRKQEEERLRFLTPEEAGRLLEACPDWFRPAVFFALNTGLRAGEIFSLRWENVDFQNRVIRVEARNTKTGDTYTVPMNDGVKKLLEELKRKQEEKGIDHGYVFTNSKGLPYKYEDKTYRKVFKTACRKAGIEDFRFHDLRHTFASWVAISSRDIYAVQKLLNHRDIRSTKRYAHLTEKYLKEVVNSLPNFASFSEKKGDQEERKEG
jgi:integrase